MEDNNTVTRMISLPSCDFCDKNKGHRTHPGEANLASYDGKTVFSYWAYMCEEHFEMYGLGLGLGRGQKLKLVDNSELREENSR